MSDIGPWRDPLFDFRSRSILERSVLGSCLINDSVLPEVMECLPDNSAFTGPLHRKIYAAMLALHRNKTPVDYVTVVTNLKENGELDTGGVTYIAGLSSAVPISCNGGHYAQALKSAFVNESIQARLETLYLKGKDGTTRADLEMAVRELSHDLTLSGSETPPRHISELIPGVLKSLAERWDDPNLCEGIPCGIDTIDEVTGGFRDGDLIVVAARPSVGKSALALMWATRAARHYKVLFYSLEMSSDQMIERALAAELQRNTRDKILPHVRKATVDPAMKMLSSLNLWIEEKPNMGLRKLEQNLVRHTACNGKPDILFIDYVQLMEVEDRERGTNRTQEIGIITKTLKGLARSADIPVVLLSQLSRVADTRGTPYLSDLRDSGSIEQDADMVFLLSRGKEATTLEVNIAKQRNGPTKKLKVFYDRETQRILAHDDDGNHRGRPKQTEIPAEEEVPF